VKTMPAAQVAFSVLDLERTVAWWREVFELAPAGGSIELTGPEAARAQGLPASESRILWLVDQQDFFQLEFFRFTEPEPRPLPHDWRPSDIGYSLVGVHVQDFDATLERAASVGSDPVGPLREQPGARRAALRDPEGAIVEIMEDDPRAPAEGHRMRPDIPCACRYVRATVSDLQASHAFFVDTLGCQPADSDLLHGDEALWGLANAQVQRAAVWAGDFVIEFATYIDPCYR
jgi:catechol 2,3-dioxygenase-like lactoylglutathione lyase family enzyme